MSTKYFEISRIEKDKAKLLFGGKYEVETKGIELHCRSMFGITNKSRALQYRIATQGSVYFFGRDEYNAYMYGDKSSPTLVFGENVINGLCHEYLGFIGFDKMDCIVTEVRTRGKVKYKKNANGEQIKSYGKDRYFDCLIHEKDGLIGKIEVERPSEDRKHYKNKVRSLVSSVIMKEIKQERHCFMEDGIGIIQTRHFKGLFEPLNMDNKYITAKFFMRRTHAKNSWDSEHMEFLGEGIYQFVINTETWEALNNKAYLNVYSFNRGIERYRDFIMTTYEKELPRCKESRFVNELINLATGEVVLNDMSLDVAHNLYITGIKNEKTKDQTFQMFIWDKKSSSIKQVMREVQCIGMPSINKNGVFLKQKNKNGKTVTTKYILAHDNAWEVK